MDKGLPSTCVEWCTARKIASSLNCLSHRGIKTALSMSDLEASMREIEPIRLFVTLYLKGSIRELYGKCEGNGSKKEAIWFSPNRSIELPHSHSGPQNFQSPRIKLGVFSSKKDLFPRVGDSH